MIKIPDELTDFLHWFKEITESHWAQPQAAPLEETDDDGLQNAKWIGLTDEQIDAIENKYSVKFTPEHREFLRILHTIDRKEKIREIKVVGDKEIMMIEERAFFCNWLTDDRLIEEYLDWPYRTILQDVLGEKKVWLRSWGERVESEDEKRAMLIKWYKAAPKLLPLRAHTFLVSDTTLENRPVLSVWGADVIIPGWSLQAYLVSQFSHILGLTEMVYDEEDKVYYGDFKDEVLTTYAEYFQFKLIHNIPYWDEMILYYNGQFHESE